MLKKKKKRLFYYAISRKICLFVAKFILVILLHMVISRKPVQRRGLGEKCSFLLLAGRHPRVKERYQFVSNWRFPHKKSNFSISTRNRFVTWRRSTSNVDLMLMSIFSLSVENTNSKRKRRSLWRHIWRHRILTNLNNAKIMFQIPSSSNILPNKNRVFLEQIKGLFINPRWRPKEWFEWQI